MQKLIFKNERGQVLELGNSAPFILQKIEGLGTPQTTILTSKSPGQDGKSYHGCLIDEGVKSIEAAILGDDVKDMYEKRRLISAFFNPKIQGKCIYMNDFRSYEIDYVVQDLTIKDSTAELQDFLLQLYCPNPFWTDIEESNEEIAAWLGKLKFPLIIPEEGLVFGDRKSNLIANIKNVGDTSCGIRIEFRAIATVVNPSFFNIETRRFIKVKRSLQEGDSLIINTGFSNKKVELVKSNGIVQNVFYYIDLQSEFLQLETGDNFFRYDAEQGIDNLEVCISYKPLYVGV